MSSTKERSARHKQSLTEGRIVEAAIEILDRDGEGGLTFRALAAGLATGSGAIYWHVADKDQILSLATELVIRRAMAEPHTQPDPREALRATALGVFDAIEAHPWIGTQLSRAPWQPAMVEVFERVGARLNALGVADDALFDCVSAMGQYILGAAAQTAAAARLKFTAADRPDVLAAIVELWTKRSPDEYPFVHKLAGKLRNHDERKSFLAGVDLILAGVRSA